MELSGSPVHVLYIMGVGRSGSTVLDRVLGNHSDVESVGELINLPILGWCNNEYCACGRRTNSCSFWSNVRSDWVNRTGIKNIQDYIELQKSMDRLWKRFHNFKPPDLSSMEFVNYANQTYAVFKSIASVSGKSIVVDSSKDPLRAFILSLIPGIDLKLVHLVRDVRGVAWSMKKAFKKNERAGIQADFESDPVWHSATKWVRINSRCEWVRKQIDPSKSIRICYEDFIKNPRNELLRLGGLVNEDFEPLAEKLEKGGEIVVGHTIAGNRLRMSANIRLKLDEEWKYKLTFYERAIIRVIAGLLMIRYKYLD